MLRDNRQLVPAIIGFGAACTATYLAYSALQRRSSAKYGGLDGLVSFSSRMIAASRAAESQQEVPFIVDPLAAVLAGPEALARRAAYTNTSSTTSSTPPAANGEAAADAAGPQVQPGAKQAVQGKQQKRPVPRIIMRTCFMDDAVLTATGASQPAAFAKTLQQLAKARRCTQVVLLGSGMDTRPWRLALPPGIAWFEVDRLDVLTAKQRELGAAGVQLVGQGNAGVPPTAAAQLAKLKNNNKSTKQYAHPLAASRWSGVAVDLQVPGWSRPLVVAGFNPAEPTVWVAEGLMYYLEPNTVAPLLQEMAAVSAPGSVLACNFLTASGLAGMRSRRQAAVAEAAAAGGSPAAASSSTQAPGGTSSAAAAAAEAAGGPANARAAAAAGAAGSKAGLLSGLRWLAGGWWCASSSSSSTTTTKEGATLTEQFKWGCPDNVQQFLDFCSWRLLDQYSWTQAARAYGWEPDLTGATTKDAALEVQFVTATVKVPQGL